MTEANYQVDDKFRVQFVWKIPEGDFLRAIFRVEVLLLDGLSEKYVLRLTEFMAGRQESSVVVFRPVEETSTSYWQLVAELVGKRISLSYEADDGRPLWLRLETLTGEHSFFSRLDDTRLHDLVEKARTTVEGNIKNDIKRETDASKD